jgi:ubiquitin C-terminal hydrolase
MTQFMTAPNDIARTSILNVVCSFCELAETRIGHPGFPFQRHAERITVVGTTNTTLTFPDQEIPECTMRVDTRQPPVAPLLALGPWLKDDASQYGLTMRNRIIDGSSLYLSQVGHNSCLSVVKSDRVLPLYTLPVARLVRLGVPAGLVASFTEDHSDEYFVACQKLLYAMPTDVAVVRLTSCPVDFWARLEQSTNRFEILYYLEALRWRLNCPHYRDIYERLELTPRLHACIEKSPMSAIASAEILAASSEKLSPGMFTAMIRVLLDVKQPDDKKVQVAQYITAKFDVTLSRHVLCEIAMLESVILQMTPAVWNAFSGFLSKLRPARPIYELACRNVQCRFFRETAVRLAPFTVEVPARERFSLCFQLLRSEPTLPGVFDALSDIVSTCGDDLKASGDLVPDVLEMVEHSHNYYALFVSFSGLSEDHMSIYTKFLEGATVSTSLTPFHGLSNLGSTCYMNAVFQQILSIAGFQRRLLSADASDLPSLRAFQDIFRGLMNPVQPVADTTAFCRVWKGWGGHPVDINEQQDANEFFHLLLDGLPGGLQELFRGRCVNSIEAVDNPALRCETPDTFFFSLSLPIGHGRLQSALDANFQPELLQGENAYEFEGGLRTGAVRRPRLATLPPVLVIHLMRFTYDASAGKCVKLTDPFEFPLALTLEGARYDLHGVVVHEGKAVAGHYYSLMRCNGGWVKMNDASVVGISADDAARAWLDNGFLVFYVNHAGVIDGTRSCCGLQRPITSRAPPRSRRPSSTVGHSRRYASMPARSQCTPPIPHWHTSPRASPPHADRTSRRGSRRTSARRFSPRSRRAKVLEQCRPSRRRLRRDSRQTRARPRRTRSRSRTRLCGAYRRS